MNFADFRNVFKCYLMEMKSICNFCKGCFDCKRFNELKCKYKYLLRRNRSKKPFYDNIYITAIRFNSKNVKYKTHCMTVDILRIRYILNQ